MASVDPVVTLPGQEPDTVVPPAPGRPARPVVWLLLGVAGCAAGVAALWLGLVAGGDAPGSLKVPIVIVGILALLVGVGRIGQGIFGPSWDAGFWLSLTWLVVLAGAALVADLLPLGEHEDTAATMFEPGNLRPDLFSARPLGTNNFSLDLLARVIHGARVSMLTVIVAVGSSIAVGATIGMLAGYYRGWFDNVVNVVTDALLSIPALVMLVALAAVLGPPTEVGEAIWKTGVGLAIVGTPTMVRLARANTLTFAQREFVLASRALGARGGRIIVRDILPNVILPVLSYAFIIMAVLVVAEGSLAFLGLGLQQPAPTWGNMIAESDLTELRNTPHIALVPGAVMFLTVFALNRVGERARRSWDPRTGNL